MILPAFAESHRLKFVDESEKGISPKSRVNGTKADVLRRGFAEAGAGATDFSLWGGSTKFKQRDWVRKVYANSSKFKPTGWFN